MRLDRTISRGVIYVAENKEDAQFRYRVKNVIDVLGGSSKWKVKYYLKKDADRVVFDGIKIMVIERQAAKDGVILGLIKRAREYGVKVLFDLDDLVFDYRDLGLIRESVQEKSWLYWVGYMWGVRRIAKRVDGFICTNEFLAGKLKRSFGKPVKVIRNSLNREQVEISEKFVEKKKVRKTAGSGFSIGYFSGSPTHKKDFGLIESELVRFLETYKDAKLKVVGYMEFSKRMQGLIDVGRVEVVKPVDYLRLQGLISKVDVNIAPLVVNDFTNCKSELKFFEAGVVETTTIASPTYAFRQAISDDENGFLAQPGEWYGKLEYLYQHPEINRKIALAAKKYALKHYYGKEFLKEVEEAYDYFAK